jgi:sucrose-6-phosphate hydrolase SacC (GH32 family)
MKDPNGMLYYDHLFYQFTPDKIDVPGPKSWGHAISKDLSHGEQLSPAFSSDSLGEIWSGSAVVDWGNTSASRLGKNRSSLRFLLFLAMGCRGRALPPAAIAADRGQNMLEIQ